jgi:hypothetical protein
MCDFGLYVFCSRKLFSGGSLSAEDAAACETLRSPAMAYLYLVIAFKMGKPTVVPNDSSKNIADKILAEFGNSIEYWIQKACVIAKMFDPELSLVRDMLSVSNAIGQDVFLSMGLYRFPANIMDILSVSGCVPPVFCVTPSTTSKIAICRKIIKEVKDGVPETVIKITREIVPKNYGSMFYRKAFGQGKANSLERKFVETLYKYPLEGCAYVYGYTNEYYDVEALVSPDDNDDYIFATEVYNAIRSTLITLFGAGFAFSDPHPQNIGMASRGPVLFDYDCVISIDDYLKWDTQIPKNQLTPVDMADHAMIMYFHH